MIRYTLQCAAGHRVESWFASAAAFETLRTGGHLRCEVCGSPEVEKALMAPRVGTGRAAPPDTAAEDVPAPSAPTADTDPVRALARLRKEVESRTEDVGPRFAEEARAIHDGTAPDRAIRGEATRAEARALAEEGIPALPLPFAPSKRLN